MASIATGQSLSYHNTTPCLVRFPNPLGCSQGVGELDHTTIPHCTILYGIYKHHTTPHHTTAPMSPIYYKAPGMLSLGMLCQNKKNDFRSTMLTQWTDDDDKLPWSYPYRKYMICMVLHCCLSDPGIPGVRSMGPSLSN